MLRIPIFLLLAGVAQSANECTYEGGWSLRINAQSCPINAPVNCGNGIQLRCCPNGLTCAGEGDYGGNWCCKEGEDCRSQASASPKCPDQTWTLWGGKGTLKDGGWCCQPGDNGFYRGNMDAVGCTSAGVRSLPTGYHFASTVPTVACVAPTSSATSTPTGSASPTPTSMEDSSSDNNASTSLSGGAIAGIVVGAMCGMGLIAGIFALAWYRKKRARNNAAAAGGGAYSSPGQAPSDMAQQPPNGDSTYYGGGGVQQPGAYHDAATKHQPPTSPFGSPQDTASELGGVQRHEMGNGMADRAYHEME
ncbi:WSC2 protein [Apiospora saccharicola]